MSDLEESSKDHLASIASSLSEIAEEAGGICHYLREIHELLEQIVGTTDGGRIKFLRTLDIANN